VKEKGKEKEKKNPQTSRDLNTCFLEHCRYIQSNNPRSTYATHILNNKHEYGPASNTIRLIQHCKINEQLIHWKISHIQDCLLLLLSGITTLYESEPPQL
jgi:hypothetical protein